MFGLIGGKANSIEPGKRMLSSMTPTIIEKDGSLYMILGTPGGSTIITSVFQVILNAYEFGMNIQDAVNFPRFHHQWIPEKVEFEKERFENKTIENLQIKGYDIKSDYIREIGRVDAIMISDTRGENFRLVKTISLSSIGFGERIKRLSLRPDNSLDNVLNPIKET